MPMKKVVGNEISGRTVVGPRFAFWPLRIFRPLVTQKFGSVEWISMYKCFMYVYSRKLLHDCGREGMQVGMNNNFTLCFAATVLSGQSLATATCGAVQGDVQICTFSTAFGSYQIFGCMMEYQKVGRGGAGNFYSPKDVENASRQNSKARRIPAFGPPNGPFSTTPR